MGPELGIVFGILSIVIIVSAILVVTLRNIFHCALALILCLFCVAGIYVTLNAEFLAAAQVLIYVGAVAILMIFAIMLTSEMASKRIVQTNKNALIAFIICLAFAFTVIELVRSTTTWITATAPLPADNTMTIGKLLMTDFMLPFEVVSVLMLAALIGAVVLAREERS
jgi:NADH-quinone oxidoreductase subunit J